MNQDFKQYSNLSPEVQLIWEVMTCRAIRSTYDDKKHPCHWFNNHYGPYPAYDWIEDLPQPSASDEQEPSEVEALCVGERYQVPELISGCRKAPIMTIGINPNLTAYYPTVDGATWCYPYFDNIEQYAYYFRHRAVCQERFSVDFIRDNIIPSTEIVAEEDGKVVKTELSSETGGVNLTIQYNGQSQRTMRLESGYKILFNPDSKGFAKGDKIAGKIALKPKTKVTLYRKPVGYYKQFQSIFDTFKKYAGPEIEKLPLRMGEDVCQGDMVACASPGWGKWFTDNALNGITQECVQKRKWLVTQLFQTNPRLIVFAGQSAFLMFYSLLNKYIQTDLDLKSDTYELLKATINDPILLKIDIGNGLSPFESRIVISPHFSYPDNFRPQSRFTKDEWETYSKEYHQSFIKLGSIVKSTDDGSRRLIFMDGSDAPSEEEVGPDVWQILKDHLYDAKDMIAHVILDEYNQGSLTIKGEHFKRNEGPCNFCVNELFAFKEGCPYGKNGTDKRRYEKILQASERIFNID